MTAGGEAWLLTLVEGMPQLVWRAVGEGFWTWSSPQWERRTGQSPAASSGMGWLDTVHPDDRDAARSAWSRAERLGQYAADLRVADRDGVYRWFQTRAKPVRAGDGSILEWLGTSTDVDDLRRLQAEQKVLVTELQHRTRNLIAVVHSIFVETLQGAASLDDLRIRFEDRLAALSRVQGLLSYSEHEPVTIGKLLLIELSALAAHRLDEQVEIAGPEAVVKDSSAQTLALAIHELATNALKYGALSSPAGKLSVAWSTRVENGRPWLHLVWRETGITRPASRAARPKGYGRLLIEEALPQQLGARTELTIERDSLRCSIDLPLSHQRPEDLRE